RVRSTLPFSPSASTVFSPTSYSTDSEILAPGTAPALSRDRPTRSRSPILRLTRVPRNALEVTLRVEGRVVGEWTVFLEQECQAAAREFGAVSRSEEHTSELQSRFDLVCRLLLEKKK